LKQQVPNEKYTYMNKRLILYVFVAALGGLLFGFDTAVVNGALEFFREYLQLESNSFMEGWVVSSALFGCVFWSIAIGWFGDRYGRRSMLRVMAILILVSAVGTGLALNLDSFIFMRLIGGVGIGGAAVLSPMYISEISPANVRGRLTVTFQLAIVIGILLAFFSDYLLITSFLALFAFFYISEMKGTVLLIILIMLVGSFSYSQGAVIWVILSEMFPNNIRARATSLASFSLWVFCFLTTLLFPVVVGFFDRESANGKGVGYIFGFYATMTLISFFFFKKYLIETKGKTLEELEKETLV